MLYPPWFGDSLTYPTIYFSSSFGCDPPDHLEQQRQRSPELLHRYTLIGRVLGSVLLRAHQRRIETVGGDAQLAIHLAFGVTLIEKRRNHRVRVYVLHALFQDAVQGAGRRRRVRCSEVTGHLQRD